MDIEPQPHYPFRFIQADALEFPLDEFDFIWASPPCQAYTVARHLHKRKHPKLINKIRKRMASAGVLYVIENVPGAPLIKPVVLCGTMFDMGITIRGIRYELRRHRLFEANFKITPKGCQHTLPVIGVYGHGESKPMRDRRGYQISQVENRRKVMGMSWANRDEIAEAIPPEYAKFIGESAKRILV